MGGVAGLFGSTLQAGITTAAAYRDARAREAAAELNAQTFDQNAELATTQAGIYRAFGEQEYKDVLRDYGTLRGEQRAEYGASGVSVNSGSAAAIQANTAAEGIYAAQQTKYQRDIQAWEKDQEATGYKWEATKLRATKGNAYVSAAASAVGGPTNMYSQYDSYYVRKNPVKVNKG